jgi:hypothetical protein
MPARKLTDEQIMQIRSDYAAGISQSAIAEKLGAAKSVIGGYTVGIPRTPSTQSRMHPQVVKCPGCPMLFYIRKANRKFCSPECRADYVKREEQQLIAELQWIAGTDNWDNIARRLGFASRKTLARRLRRSGAVRWAREVELVDMPHEQSRAA